MKRRPNGFYQDVRDLLPFRVSNTTIAYVAKGKRVNDTVLMAFITADHNLQNKRLEIPLLSNVGNNLGMVSLPIKCTNRPNSTNNN